jgi:hypothetical protein
MSIDDLTGRELDAAVAARLFGHVVEERANARTGQRDYVHVTRPYTPTRDWVRVPHYNSSLSASITVEAELQRAGWTRKGAGYRPGPSRDVTVVLEHRDGRVVEASGPFETALCRAALRVVAP